MCGWRGLSFLVVLVVRPAFADLAAVQRAEEIAVKTVVEKFNNEFVQDKNVMGPSTGIDGKPVPAGAAKGQLDRDDKIGYRSNLTFHDFPYKTIDETAQKNKQNGGNGGNGNDGAGTRGGEENEDPNPTLPANVSPHGGLSAAGGSSVLERKSYEWHKKYLKQDAKNAKQLAEEEQKTGIKYNSLFRTNTQEIVENENASKEGGAKNKEQKKTIKVERDAIRDEARKDIEEVGTQSFETIEKAAKDDEEKDNPKVMPHLTFLYEAARRATEALWNATLANFGQLRINKAVASANGNDAQLSEEAARCDDLPQQQAQKIAEIKDPQAQKAAQEELQKQVQQCKQVAQISFRAIAPRFEPDKKGQDTLKEKGVKEEDARERDDRLQLSAMAQPEQDINNIPSNWKYDPKDSKASVVLTYDENGNPQETQDMTMKEQIDTWNEEVKNAKDDYEKAKQRIPLAGTAQQVEDRGLIEGKSLPEINRPADAMYEEFGLTQSPSLEPVPQSYEELVEGSQNGDSQ